MNTPKLITVILICSAFVFNTTINSQIIINPGPTVTPEDMVEFLMGPGVSYENVSFQGDDPSSGIFTNGGTTNLDLGEGIFLTSGDGYNIPGPNVSTSSGSNNGTAGHPLLDDLTSSITYDAAVLEFDFIAQNDTMRCYYVFGSEEYNEWVGSSFNDVFGFFVNGPNPAGGDYENENVAIVPGTSNTPVTINNVNYGYAAGGVVPTGPCTNCDFFKDNTFGLTLEYDAITTVLPIEFLVIPGETYHFVFAVADAGDGIYDTGVFIEGASFKSPGPAEFFAFDFLAENNPDLAYDVIGEIEDQNINLKVPQGTDLSNLVASYEEHGAYVYVNGVRQENNITANDFTNTVEYQLVGYESADWNVVVEVSTDVPQYYFNTLVIGPNPSSGDLRIDNPEGVQITIVNTVGNILKKYPASNSSFQLSGLNPGIYFIRLEKDGVVETRKVVVL